MGVLEESIAFCGSAVARDNLSLLAELRKERMERLRHAWRPLGKLVIRHLFVKSSAYLVSQHRGYAWRDAPARIFFRCEYAERPALSIDMLDIKRHETVFF